jgi:hypothetical protein
MRSRSVFLAACALLATTASFAGTPPFRLFEIFVERVIKDTNGTPIFDVGRLNALGVFTHEFYQAIPRPEQVPNEVLNLNLLPFSLFPAYNVLGSEALANFSLQHSDLDHLPPDGFFTFSGQSYFVITLSPQPKLDVGNVVNISTRSTIAPGGDPLIAGFVIQDHPRRALIRGIGPTLRNFGVTTPLANPTLTVFHQGQAGGIAADDDWEQQGNPADLESAAALTGAFPLPHGSKDAALLIQLPPGVYTAHVGSGDGTGGTALIEIYILP